MSDTSAPTGPVLKQDGTVLTGVVQLASGAAHTCALLRNGDVVCWGLNANGQLGTTVGQVSGCLSGPCVPQPGAAAITGATAISAGSVYNCAIVGGGVQCWGSGDFGQLGNGTIGIDSPTPVQVTGLSNVTSLDAGFSTACAIVGGATIMCWGDGEEGHIGDGSCLPDQCHQFPTPVQVLTPRIF
jgi:alpha-tubulin suppressor-like RCC1 family protein